MKLISIFLIFVLANIICLFDKCAGKASTTEKEQELEEDCISYKIAPITKVLEYLPDAENDSYIYEVSFLVRNGCGGFSDFLEEKYNDTLEISVNAKYSGCVCTLAMQELSTFYELEIGKDIRVIKFVGDGENFSFNIH